MTGYDLNESWVSKYLSSALNLLKEKWYKVIKSKYGIEYKIHEYAKIKYKASNKLPTYITDPQVLYLHHDGHFNGKLGRSTSLAFSPLIASAFY